jgi:phage protein D
MLIVDAQIKINNKKIEDKVYHNLEKVKVSTSVDAIGVAKIVFHDPFGELQENADFDIGKEIEISIGYIEFEKIFEGEIIRVDYNFARGHAPTVELVCFDKLFKLSRMKHSRPFVKMKDSDIAQKMAGEAGLQASVDATSTKHEYIFQNNESNLDFLRRRARRLGYEVAIEEGKFIFKKARFKDKKKSVDLNFFGTLIDFQVKIDASKVEEEVMVSSWDYVKKEGIEEKAKAGDEPKVGTPKKMGTKETKDKMKNEAKAYKLDLPNLTSGDAKEIAKSKLTADSMSFLKANGSCEGEPKIQAGKVLNIKNLGKKLSGEYYITECEHIYTQCSYRTYFDVISNGVAK